MRIRISWDDLVKKLSYSKHTGIFRWKVKPRQRACSEIAGTINEDGYRQICINQVVYKAHRLAWFYCFGEWPSSQIDHINGDKDDNRIDNLRLANHQQNQANSKVRGKYKGVYLHKASGLYHARVMSNYKNISLGYFKTPEEAYAAYCVAAKEFFGEYARER